MNSQAIPKLHEAKNTRAIRLSLNISILFAGCLAFLVPFEAARNIDLQGLILLLSGLFAWVAVLLGKYKPRLEHVDQLLVGVFLLGGAVSVIANPHVGYDLLGAPYLRLGSLGLLACIGVGLALRDVSIKRLIPTLYLLMIAIALVSLPYYLLKFHAWQRIGGVFAQADIFAVFLGSGLLLGLYMIRLYPRQRTLLVGAEVFMALLLLATETRVVIGLVIVLTLAWFYQFYPRRAPIWLTIYVIGILVVVAAAHFAPSNRLTANYAASSASYRLTLQASALQASTRKPLVGYGVGNLADALACRRLTGRQLKETCRQGYFFNSSHNIFIDRILGLGWIGGAAFLVLVLRALNKGWRVKSEVLALTYVFTLCGSYYLTNVTSVPLELLFWVLLLRLLATA